MKIGLALPKYQPDYDEFFTEWLPKATAMAAKRGLHEPEDAAANVLFAIWRNGYLETWYAEGGASLNTYISRMVEMRLIDERRSQRRRVNREVVATDVTELPEEQEAPADPGLLLLEAGWKYDAFRGALVDEADRETLKALSALVAQDEDATNANLGRMLGIERRPAKTRHRRLVAALAAIALDA